MNPAHTGNWIKSTFCEASGCIYVGTSGHGETRRIHIGDGTGAVLTVTQEEWDVFLQGVKAGEFD